MVGRLETIEYRVGVKGATLRLLGPKDPWSIRPATVGSEGAEGATRSPYWNTPWPAGRMLGEYLVNHFAPPPYRILEIGAGLGLTGLIAALFDFRVMMTDYNPIALEFIRASAELNRLRIEEPRILDWHAPPAERFEMIIAADVTYERSALPAVVRLLDHCLNSGGLALLGDQYRVKEGELEALLARVGMIAEPVPVECQAIPRPGSLDGRTFRGRIFRIERRRPSG